MNKRNFNQLSSDNIVAFLGDIFERRGADSYLGEQVTMSEHMLQGAQLAEDAKTGDDSRMIIRSLSMSPILSDTTSDERNPTSNVRFLSPPVLAPECPLSREKQIERGDHYSRLT